MSLPLANSIEGNSINISANFNFGLSNNNDDDHGSHGHNSPRTPLPLTTSTSKSASAVRLCTQMDIKGEGRDGIPEETQQSFSFSWENNRASYEESEWNVGESTGPSQRNYNNNGNYFTGNEERGKLNNNSDRPTFSQTFVKDELLLLHEEVDGCETLSSSLRKTSSLFPPSQHHSLSNVSRKNLLPKVLSPLKPHLESTTSTTVAQPTKSPQFQVIPWEISESGDTEIKKETVTLQFFSPSDSSCLDKNSKKFAEKVILKEAATSSTSPFSTVRVTRSAVQSAEDLEGEGRARKSKKVDFQIPTSDKMEGKLMGTESIFKEGPAEDLPVSLREELESESQEQEVENRRDKSNKKHVTTSSVMTSTTPTTGTTDGQTKKGAQSQLTSTSVRRRSRSPTNNIMREIRKMSLASQDAKEEKKKAAAAVGAGGGGGGGGGGSGSGGAGSSSSVGPGGIANSKKAAKRLSRRRKRREEEYTDKDRAAAVTLGSRDIKQSLKAKKKRERKLHISIDLLHSEDFLSAMFVVEAAYQMRVKKQTTAALITLNKALELQPTHKAALVARSQCHLKLGDAASALKDAETSFEGNETYIMGLYQYAEALYNLGQFEKALIAYHRGYRIRKVESFRIGIQKSQEAIRRAIGDRSATQIEDLDEILPLIDEQEALANLKQEHGSICPAPTESSGVPTTSTLGSGGGGGGGGVGAGGATGGSKRTGTGSKHMAPSKSRARWVAREVLGQMYFDKDYLTKFLHRPDIQSDQGASQELRSNATEALHYLEIREQFWRQQNPMYARKQGLNLNNKVVLQVEPQPQHSQQQQQDRERQDVGRRLEVEGMAEASKVGSSGLAGCISAPGDSILIELPSPSSANNQNPMDKSPNQNSTSQNPSKDSDVRRQESTDTVKVRSGRTGTGASGSSGAKNNNPSRTSKVNHPPPVRSTSTSKNSTTQASSTVKIK